MQSTKHKADFSGVEETALLTLYAKAMESQSADPILKDEKAEKMVRQIDPYLRERSGKMARQLYERTVDPRLTIHIPLRSKKYDQYALGYLAHNPDGTIINIGCGMDARFFRIDNGQVRFYDLDLPEMIRFKRQFLEVNKRYRMIGQSVLDFSWMDQIKNKNRPVLILAEGVLMYLPQEEVKNLVLKLQQRFPDSELICELTNRTWVEGFWGKLAAIKMKQRVKMGGDAGFQFGVSHAGELESWGKGIEFLERWFYMDDNHPKLGWMRIFRNMRMIRDAQFTARYRLHQA